MIVYTSCVIIIFAVLIAFYNGRANKFSFLLSLYLIIFSIYPLTYHYSFYSNNDFALAIIFYNFSPLYFLAGPLIYFYVFGTLKDKIEWKWIHLLHILPFLIFLINAIPYLSTPFEHKLEFARLIHEDKDNLKRLQYNLFVPNAAGMVLRPLSVGIYILASFYQIYKSSKYHRQETRQYRFIIRWLIVLLLVSSSFMIIYGYAGSLAYNNDIKTTFTILQKINNVIGGLFLTIPLSILMFPQILYGIPVSNIVLPKNAAKEISSTKKYIDETNKNYKAFKLLSQNIIHYFDNEKPYLNQQFSLSDLASAMNVPQHHISYCFSDFLNVSFTKLRTAKRIEHAKLMLLQSQKDITIDKIAELSGFSSRSSFFSTFKEITGMTPTEFIEQSNCS